MKLFWSPASPFARKVRCIAREKGLAQRIEEIEVPVYNDPAELIAANPLGKIPALVLADGEALYDSPVICAYLDAHPEGQGPALCPTSGIDRWRVLRAEALADGAMDLALSLTYEKLRKPEAERSPTSAARWRGQLRRAVSAMTQEIAGLPQGFTLGHLSLACALGYLDLRHPDMGWREGQSELAGWYEEIARRPSLAETAPPTA
jgi:glutathione S-transferase